MGSCLRAVVWVQAGEAMCTPGHLGVPSGFPDL